MPVIKIDNLDYELDSLSAEARGQLSMMQMADRELQNLQVQIALAQTARNAYANALKQLLPTPTEQLQAQGETIKLS